MALLHAEPFDWYANGRADMALRGYNNNGTNWDVINDPTLARTGNKCVNFDDNNDLQGFIWYLDDYHSVLGQGCAYNIYDLSTTTEQVHGMRFGASGQGANLIGINVGSDMSVNVWQGSTLRGATGPNVWPSGAYGWLEAKVFINDGGLNTGRVIVKRGKNTVLEVNGINLTQQFNAISLGQRSTSGNTGASARFDDWVCWDTTGTINNDFLGDRQIDVRFPTDDEIIDWLLSSGVNAYELIDKVPAVDTDYIGSSVANDVAEFDLNDSPYASNNIAAVIAWARAFQDVAGAADFQLGVNAGGTNAMSGNISPTTSPLYYSHLLERNPNGNISWTKATADAVKPRLLRV